MRPAAFTARWPLSSWPCRFAVILAERVGPDESEQPGMLVEQPGRNFRLELAHPGQICPYVCEHADHSGQDGPGIARTLQAAVRAVDNLGSHQPVGNILRAAKADLDQVTPAAAYRPQAGPGSIANEDGFPLADDEILPPEIVHLFQIMVIHVPNSAAVQARAGL
jgi:hypothetical protein